MKKSYLNGISCISAQPTADEEDFFQTGPISYDTPVFKAHKANYKQYIKPVAMRRMSPSVKMGVSASYMALDDAGIKRPDAVLTGTGRGCRQDSELFLENLLENKEEFLTPIKFIQSTHNTVGGRIALELDCNAYNFTYVQDAVSFESALTDAQLMILNETNMKNVLVGGIDELAKKSMELYIRNGEIKQEQRIHNLDLLKSQTKGSLASEGAAFFVLSKEKNETSYAELVDVGIYNRASPKEMEQNIAGFLLKNKLQLKDVDAVMLGNNGDSEFDFYYETLQKNIFETTAQLGYKHLMGEHHTVSSAGMWLATKVLKQQTVPGFLKLNAVQTGKNIQNILLYNQNKGRNHSLILLKAC